MNKKLIVYADGAIRSDPAASGLGVIIKNEQGEVLRWLSKTTGQLTCNEAEYAALIFALEEVRKYRPRVVEFHLDNEVVVNQMKGLFRVHSPALKRLHAQASRLARTIPRVTFTHVRRERNRLADALANEAVEEVTSRK